MAPVRLTIQGGPFDGGAVEVPRRTPPGLRLSLTSDDVTASYRITGTPDGTCVVLFEEQPPQDQTCSTASTLPAGSRNHAMSGPRPSPRTMPRSSEGNSASL